jgi:hypothetical protein
LEREDVVVSSSSLEIKPIDGTGNQMQILSLYASRTLKRYHGDETVEVIPQLLGYHGRNTRSQYHQQRIMFHDADAHPTVEKCYTVIPTHGILHTFASREVAQHAQ